MTWGTSRLQRARLAPLYAALRAGPRLPVRGGGADGECAGAGGPGLSVVIPERDAPELLREALAALAEAGKRLVEPLQAIVVVNGAPLAAYDTLRGDFPQVEWLHDDAPLGFSAAIGRGLAKVRHDWTLLLNNDMRVEPDALAELARHRAPQVFALSAQIVQRSASGRREETGFVDWYCDAGGVHAFHAPVPDTADPAADAVPHLAGSGGATLFRTGPLARYVRDSVAYDPFYWEDIEWGLRAWRDGHRVLFCRRARAHHRHRATTSRFYAPQELDRIVARNALLFDLRNRVTPFGADWLMQRVCDQPYATQRELARPRVAAAVARLRAIAAHARAEGPRPPQLADPHGAATQIAPGGSFSFRFRPLASPPARPRLLLVTPFAVFPPRHGGARRIAGLLATLRRDFDTIVVTDEAALYDARSFAGFDGLAAVHVVQRPREAEQGAAPTLEGRMRSHDHPALAAAVRDALARYRPDVVQVEFAELAVLVREKKPGQCWVLGLHDAYGDADFATPEAAEAFRRDCLDRYDAVTVCSREDLALVRHRNVVCIPNGSSLPPIEYVPSTSSRLLFLGPFRYGPNLAGVRAFLREAFPAIKQAIPDATLRVLGGDGAPARVADDPLFARADVTVAEHTDDVAGELAACALTINPLAEIRGSPVKLVESIAAGRACVSTRDGARGFADDGLEALVVADGIAAMAAPVVRLLTNARERHRIERADADRVARYTWPASAQAQKALYDALLAARA